MLVLGSLLGPGYRTGHRNDAQVLANGSVEDVGASRHRDRDPVDHRRSALKGGSGRAPDMRRGAGHEERCTDGRLIAKETPYGDNSGTVERNVVPAVVFVSADR